MVTKRKSDMKTFRLSVLLLSALIMLVTNCIAEEEQFDSDKMLSDLERQLQLNSEKMSKLKSALNTKSDEMRNSIKDAVDKGFIELDELSGKLDAVSQDAELKVKEFLTGDEVAKLKEYLKKVDKDAIKQARDKLVEEMTELLLLTEEQVKQLKPVLDESVMELSKMLSAYAKEGRKGWEEFKTQYEQFVQELREKLEGILDDDQMQRYERYNREQKEKIKSALMEV